MTNKPPLIVAAGYSYNPHDLQTLQNNFTTYVINHASRGYDSLNLYPDHYLFLDSPLGFSRRIQCSNATKKHCSSSHKKWFDAGYIQNYELYKFDKSKKPETKNHWYDPEINPFIQEQIQHPYLTFLFTLQIVMRTKPNAIYFYGCDFNLQQSKNYYFESELNRKQYLGKLAGINFTLRVFDAWSKYINVPMYSFSKDSKLSKYVSTLTIEEFLNSRNTNSIQSREPQ